MFMKDTPTGAVADFTEVCGGAAWKNMEKLIDSEKTLKEFELFKFSFVDSISSFILANVIKKGHGYSDEAIEEDLAHESLNLQNYLDTSNFIKYNNNQNKVVVGSAVKERFSRVLSDERFSKFIGPHVERMRKLNSVHQIYEFRKALARSDLVECGDDVHRLLKQLNCERGWPELSGDDIKAALTQNLTLLRKLKDDKEFISSVSESRTSEVRTRLLKKIEEKYSEELCEYAKESNKLRIARCRLQRDMENFMMKRSGEAQAAGLKYLPEEFSRPRHPLSFPCQLSLHPQIWKRHLQQSVFIISGALSFISLAGWNAKRLKKIMN